MIRVTFPLTVMIISAVCQGVGWAEEPKLSLSVGVELRWTAEAGRVYQPEWTAVSGGDEWNALGAVVPGEGQVVSVVDETPAGNRSYRVSEVSSGGGEVDDLVTNGGFEAGTGSTASAWDVSHLHVPSLMRTDVDAHSGSFSMLALIENEGITADSGVLTQEVGLVDGSIVPGESYQLSFWAKNVRATPTFIRQYQVEWKNGAGSWSGGGYVVFSGGAGGWSEVMSPAMVAPNDAVGARVVFRFATGAVAGEYGEVGIDEVKFASMAADEGGTVGDSVVDRVTSPMMIVSWPTVPGATYRPQSTSDLVGGEWTDLPVVAGDGGVKSIATAMAGRVQFVRLAYTLPSVDGGEITPLYSGVTALEPEVMVDTPLARISYLGDRARDRHAREDVVNGTIFRKYDHYLSWYWEQRTAQIEIIDRVGKTGNGALDGTVTFNFTTQARLDPAEFRTFYRGIGTVAEYHNNMSDNLNAGVTLVSSHPSVRYPGETDFNYTATITQQRPENRDLRVGDRMEVELSQFLLEPRNGRENYYGTAFLYIVGEGVVPWYAKYREEAAPADRETASFDSYPLPRKAWLGGLTTLPYQYSNEPAHRFKQTAGNISPENIQPFMQGRRLHHTDFLTGEHTEPGNPVFVEHAGKVGPKFVAQSCVACHTNNGRGLPSAVGQPLLRSVVRVGVDASGAPHPELGEEVQPNAVSGASEGTVTLAGYTSIHGTYGDGTAYVLRKPYYAFAGITPDYFSVRNAPPLVGLGLLEAVDEQTIQMLADPNDVNQDGISGRIAVVEDPENPGVHRLGRFTSKGSQARLVHQIAYALNRDMGITTDVFPVLDGETAPHAAEISSSELDEMNRYVALLGVGARRDLTDPEALRGETLFASASCVSCHAPELPLGQYHPMTELRRPATEPFADLPIQPYTDLLLHDMGEGLADNMGDEGATGSEWRTAPLWNIGLTAGVSGGEAYLHDGRARTLEEAILWHGGEAEQAKENFRTMPAVDRAALVKFLQSL